ncbi:MAG: hypothetical protein L6R35_000634 [Caloplaca aegaea]|nr:MAG: hypothetical protein L6R35_000634 [Caloplaca aegaea]
MGSSSVIVVLGASGNLAAKKLHRRGTLDEKFKLIGFDLTPMNQDEFNCHMESCVDPSSPKLKDDFVTFSKRCSYITLNKDAGDDSFVELNKRMESFIEANEVQNRHFYMALPPNVYVAVSEQLRRNCYSDKGNCQIIIEKPFGHDLESSLDLHRKLEPNWKESEIFRIDHYLGKEMVKNLLTLRSVWTKRQQISMTETIGTEGRGGYFDDVGIIRDVMQNRLFAPALVTDDDCLTALDLMQLLALTTMERPGSFDAEDLRQEKARVLRLVPPLDIKNTMIGQFCESVDGRNPGYEDDDSVPQGSRCATFCASVAYVKNARWEGVPFILKSGKALDESKTEIRIQLKDTTDAMLRDTAHNQLIIRIQPDEAVRLKMNTKLPGLGLQTVATELDLTYQRTVSNPDIPEAYESLLLDAFSGDYSDSVSEQELEATWKIFTPLLHHLEGHEEIMPAKYTYGSEGPDRLEGFVASYQYRSVESEGQVV